MFENLIIYINLLFIKEDLPMKEILTATNLSKTYVNGEITVKAVDQISFKINKGEVVIILGQSGAGKSTLLNLIGGMELVTSGSLVIDDEEVSKYTAKQLVYFRRHKIGFVFQFYNLMPNLTAKENVELATELKSNALDPTTVLNSVGLSDKLDSFPSQLSGGQQQRVSIARALAKNCDIILCDEPTGALDYETGKEILSLLVAEAHKYKKTVIIVTHNSALSDMGDHLIKLRNGKIIYDELNPNPKPIEDIEW